MAPPLAQSSPTGEEDQGRRLREKGKGEGRNTDDPDEKGLKGRRGAP